MPKVTVVIPSYNHGCFLAARLDSVLAQTYRDFEVLFLDDASTDDSLEVFARYRDRPQVRAIVNEVNGGGVFRQWNRGVGEARGEYVWLAESDDVADPAFLETLVPLLDRHPNAGLAYCKSLHIDEDGRVTGDTDDWTRPVHPTRWSGDHVNGGPDECRRYLCRRNTIPNASAVVFRKRLYDQAGYADEDMRLCGDWAMWVKMLLASDVAYVARPLNLWRVAHAASVRREASGSMGCLEAHLTILGRIVAAGPLPPEMIPVVAEDCVWGWQHHADRDPEAENPLTHSRCARLAAELGPAFQAALVAAVMGHAVHSRRRLEGLERRVAGLERQAEELALWRRLHRLLVPENGWRRRVARSVVRLFR